MRVLVTVIFLFGLISGGFWPSVVLATPPPEPVQRREIPEERIEAYRQLRTFRYEQPPPRGAGLWERFWIWVWETIDRLFSGTASWKGYKVLQWFLPAAILMYAIFRISGMDHVMPWRRLAGKSTHSDDAVIDDIHAVDFDAGITAAVAEGRYRDAVRLQYLQTLKLLADGGFIDWRSDKTNVDYATELSDTPLQEDFFELTRVFEYVWYGEMPVNGDAYTKIEPGFRGFRKSMMP